MTRTEAKKALKTYGRIEFNGCEIWETVSAGEHTGLYRVAPIGRRDEHSIHTPESVRATAALDIADRIGSGS